MKVSLDLVPENFFCAPIGTKAERNQGEKPMFFVRGLTSNGKVVLVNPDQVLYVGESRMRSGKTAMVLTHGKRLIVDQDAETIRQRFEDDLKDVGDSDDRDASDTGEPGAGQTHQKH
jgi:hypothetical protein